MALLIAVIVAVVSFIGMVLAVVLWAACTLSGRLSEEEEQ